jgi:hypothetical protein
VRVRGQEGGVSTPAKPTGSRVSGSAEGTGTEYRTGVGPAPGTAGAESLRTRDPMRGARAPLFVGPAYRRSLEHVFQHPLSVTVGAETGVPTVIPRRVGRSCG